MQVSLKQNVIEIQFATCDSVNVLSLIVVCVCAFYHKTKDLLDSGLDFPSFLCRKQNLQKVFFGKNDDPSQVITHTMEHCRR